MSDNLTIVTLLWEKGGVVYRRWLVQTTGERTLPDDVPLPERGIDVAFANSATDYA